MTAFARELVSQKLGRGVEPLHPREQRRRAFRALRELCRTLSVRRPLVLFIDDLQWGDADSIPLFTELLAPPDPPPVFVLCAFRGDDERTHSLLAPLRGVDPRHRLALSPVEVELRPLAFEHASELARRLLAESSTGHRSLAQAAERIASESEGSPFFVRELAQYAADHGVDAAQPVRLEALIQTKVDMLSEPGRVLLSLIALSGRPIPVATVRAASGLEDAVLRALHELQAHRLVATSGWENAARVECQHDRVREAVCLALGEPTTATLHRRLAAALELAPELDADALLEHWRGAGDLGRAAHYALIGADKAERALAFRRAADLCRIGMTLLPTTDQRLQGLRERLGHLLILAGCGAEAAAVFQSLLPGATREKALQYRTLATAQLLRGGKLEEGFEELKLADDLFGVRFPRSEARAVAMLVTRRARIAIRAPRLQVGPAGPSSGATNLRLEALWEVAAAVSIADFLRGRVYGTELMLRAMDTGDPAHIAGACGLEAVAAASDMPRTERMIALAEQAGRFAGQPHLQGRVRGMQAICRQLQGRWLASVELARDSQRIQLRSARNNWDHAIMIWWEMSSAAQAGQVAELAAKVPEALRDAEARGDVYAATSFRTHRCSWAWLGTDQPEVAERHVATARREWTPRGYQFQHWHMTYAQCEVDLYRKTPEDSLARVTHEWSAGRLVRQVSAVRSDMLHARGRLLLATARNPSRPRRSRLLAQARADAMALQRQGQSWTAALGALLLAGVGSFEEPRTAVHLYQDASLLCEQADMPLHAAVARLRSAELSASMGHGSSALADDWLQTIANFGVQCPERFGALLAP